MAKPGPKKLTPQEVAKIAKAAAKAAVTSKKIYDYYKKHHLN